MPREFLTDEETEAAWRREVDARVESLVAGEVTLVPWEEVRARLLARLEEKRSEGTPPGPAPQRPG